MEWLGQAGKGDLLVQALVERSEIDRRAVEFDPDGSTFLASMRLGFSWSGKTTSVAKRTIGPPKHSAKTRRRQPRTAGEQPVASAPGPTMVGR
jgi:hypothetical protein